MSEVSACLALIFKLDQDMPQAERRELSRKLLIVRMDVGVEPSDIFETARIYRHKSKWSHDGVEGIFQINNMHDASGSWDNEMTGEQQEYARMCWQEFRDDCDRQGWGDVPAVYMQIIHNSEQVTTPVMPIFQESIQEARRKPDYTIPENPKYARPPRSPDPVGDRLR